MTATNLGYVGGIGYVFQSYADLATQLKEFQEANAVLVSVRDEAQLRVATKGGLNIGKEEGTLTSIGFEFAGRRCGVLNGQSRLLDLSLAEEAVQANRANRYLSTPTRKEYEKTREIAEQDEDRSPKEQRAIVLPSRGIVQLTPRKNAGIYDFLFENQAKAYWDMHVQKNGKTPIEIYPIEEGVVDSQEGTILTQLWFRSLDDRSVLEGDDRGLNYYDGARGVLRKSAEGASQILDQKLQVRAYTPEQAEEWYRILKNVRDGNLAPSSLEELIKFFKSSIR